MSERITIQYCAGVAERNNRLYLSGRRDMTRSGECYLTGNTYPYRHLIADVLAFFPLQGHWNATLKRWYMSEEAAFAVMAKIQELWREKEKANG